MDARIPQDDVQLLRTHGLSDEDITHSIMVADLALKLVEELPAGAREALDMELVVRGALLHDLGKGRDGSLAHGEAGFQLALELGLPAKLGTIMDKHVLAGLTPVEAENMGLPQRERSLSSLEEKLVVYADKLADIIEETDQAADLTEARSKHEAILMADLGMSKNSELARDRYIQAGKDTEAAIVQG
jgi:uncharacterized protein